MNALGKNEVAREVIYRCSAKPSEYEPRLSARLEYISPHDLAGIVADYSDWSLSQCHRHRSLVERPEIYTISDAMLRPRFGILYWEVEDWDIANDIGYLVVIIDIKFANSSSFHFTEMKLIAITSEGDERKFKRILDQEYRMFTSGKLLEDVQSFEVSDMRPPFFVTAETLPDKAMIIRWWHCPKNQLPYMYDNPKRRNIDREYLHWIQMENILGIIGFHGSLNDNLNMFHTYIAGYRDDVERMQILHFIEAGYRPCVV